MKKVILTLTVAAFFAAIVYAGMGEVLTSWQAPGPYNRVNGIAFEGEYIWLNNGAAETRGVLKCTTSGSLIKDIGFPYHGWGPAYALAFDGVYLWTIFHQPVGTIKYNHYVKYTTNGSEAGHFVAHPFPGYGMSISISWDGQYLWTDERPWGEETKAGKYTTAGSLVGTFAVPQVWRTDAAYYNNQLWTGSLDNYVYGMNIGASTFVASFPAPGGSCYAVGFDGEYLWTADRNEPQYIYKVDIEVVDVNPDSLGKIKSLYR
jgi:hypothetical protein